MFLPPPPRCAGTRAAERAAKGDAELTSQRAEGKYGQGQFKNEPWGLQSYQKRVYAVREFYRAALRKHGSAGGIAVTPADDEAVVGMLGSISRTVGLKRRHVPEVTCCVARRGTGGRR